MAKKISLTPTRSKWTGSRSWTVNIPARISPSGKRERYFFATKVEADAYCEPLRIGLENFGAKGSKVLSPGDTDQAANAMKLLAPYGVTLNEVIQDWIARKQAAEASIKFSEAMDGFTDWRKRSESYTRSIRQTKNRLATLHDHLLNQITPADLNKAMHGMTASVRNFTIRILGGLFNFGIKRGYCSDNPTKLLDLSQRDPTEIEIHPVPDVVKIFHAAEAHDQGLIPFLALSFFCGIRRSEALRLNWFHIDLEEDFVKLPASITKTKKGRHIQISANCRAWLLPHSAEKGRIFPHSGNILRDRQAALKAHHGVPTIKHGPRHCFASYWLAEHNDINLLCRMLGHDDPETTFEHYAKAATKRDATKFWAITPSAVPANVVDINAEVAA